MTMIATPKTSPVESGRMRHALGIAVLVLAAALGLASCGTDSHVLAQVGSRTITTADFLDYARAAKNPYPILPDSAKRVLLDDLVRRDLLLLEAEQRGLTKDTMLTRIRGAAEDELLLGALSEQVAPRSVPVSQAELAEFYDWHKTEHHLQVIFLTDARFASDAMARLRAGQPFTQVAMVFNSSGVVPPDGDLGWIPGGGMIEPLDASMRAARVGALIGPLRAGDNWFIARVLGRRPVALPPFEAIGKQLTDQVSERKHRAAIQRVVTTLREEYRLRLEPGGPQELFMRANRPPGDSTAAVRPIDQNIVLARYDAPGGAGRYTLADALREMQGSTDAPNFSSLPGIERWVESRVVRRLVLIEARRRHLDQEPEVARQIQQRVDGAVLQSLYDSEVAARVQITEDDMRAEYARRVQNPNPPAYESMPPEVKEQLRGLTVETRRDALLREFTDGLARKFPVRVNQDRLRRLQWPEPMGLEVGQG